MTNIILAKPNSTVDITHKKEATIVVPMQGIKIGDTIEIKTNGQPWIIKQPEQTKLQLL